MNERCPEGGEPVKATQMPDDELVNTV